VLAQAAETMTLSALLERKMLVCRQHAESSCGFYARSTLISQQLMKLRADENLNIIMIFWHRIDVICGLLKFAAHKSITSLVLTLLVRN
jgi:predicted double-glycine peptidase